MQCRTGCGFPSCLLLRFMPRVAGSLIQARKGTVSWISAVMKSTSQTCMTLKGLRVAYCTTMVHPLLKRSCATVCPYCAGLAS